jgi:archaemetzincin
MIQKVNVQVLPIGEVDPETLKMLVKRLGEIFPTSELLDNVPIVDSAYDSKRDQYLSDEFLREVKWHAAVNGEKHILGVTNVDLFTQGLNFVFGQAELPGQAAVISLNRLNHDSHNVFVSRMYKEAFHELGHTMGLRHCQVINCVMHFSNSLKDTDIKDERYCNHCNEILLRKLQR